MHICTIKSDLLTEGLQKVIKVRQSNGLRPALEAVHCKTFKGGNIVATATNLDTTIFTGIKCEVKEAGSQFLIPIKAQHILQQLKDVDIEVHLQKEELSFHYKDNIINFFADDVSDFPVTNIPETAISKFTIEDHREFRQTLEMHRKVASTDEMQPLIQGVHFTNQLLCSSDTHRLIKTRYETEHPGFDIIVSKTFINALSSITSAVTITIAESQIMAGDKNTKIISRTIDGEFPDFSAAIPKGASPLHISVDRIELLGNIKLAMSMTEKTFKRLHFKFTDDGYELSAGEKEETIKLKGECAFAVNKDDVESFEVTYNGKYLSEILDIPVTETVTLYMTEPRKATAIRHNNSLLLIMPILI